MFWAVQTRFPAVADVMSRCRFELLLRCFHCVDNTTQVPDQNKLFKVRPLLNANVSICRIIPQEELPVCELTYDFLQRDFSIKQYVKRIKNGNTVFMRCKEAHLTSSTTFPFILVKKRATPTNWDFLETVVGLCKTYLPKYDNLRRFIVGWFTFLPLFTNLKNKGIWVTGVLRNVSLSVAS